MILDSVAEEKSTQEFSKYSVIRSESVALCDFMLSLVANTIVEVDQTESISAEHKYLENFISVTDHKSSAKKIYNSIIGNPAECDKNLLSLAFNFSLSDYEILTLSILLGVEKNSMIGRCLAYVQSPVGGARPTLGLLDSIFSQFKLNDSYKASSILLSGRAMEMGLIKVLNSNLPIPEQSFFVPLPLVIAFQGLETKWPGSRKQLSKYIELPSSMLMEAKHQAELLYQKTDQVLVIRSGLNSEAENVAARIAEYRFQRALYLENMSDNLIGLAPYLYLHNAIPVFETSLGPSDQQQVAKIPGYSGPIIVICSLEGRIEFPQGTTINWNLDKPLRQERLELWRKQLPQGTEFQELAEQQLHSAGRISEISQLAKRIARSEGREQVKRIDLQHAILSNEGSGLGSLAQLVTNRIPDDALILGKETKNELQLLLARCRHRESLSDDLGVTLRARYQSGVRSLLVGPSGTGKTLAASWLATLLNLPLYRVDLASVSSKYIGETEKNLSQLLNKAEQEEVILLFDEADSMFGKRTDINDANDRFANAQTNYLLQRIETYGGIVLMTSNSRSRFDTAFTRRIDMIIEFATPKPEQRRDLWRCHLGKHHNLSNAQLNQLSAIADLCGGHIRNVVLTASVLAKTEGRVIEYQDLRLGIKSEYRKLGKKIPIELIKSR